MHDTGNTQLDDAMVISFAAFAAAFPPIHPLAVVIELAVNKYRILGFNQPLLCREEFVSRINDVATQSGLLEPHPRMKRVVRLIMHN